MPSTITFGATPAKTSTSSIYARPQKKQKMSITQTYFLAHSARGKLSKEAARADHNLRLLVGHANMLDSLMLDLANAERDQERWFNQSISGAQPEEEEVNTPETISEEAEDADNSDDELDFEMDAVNVTTTQVDDDMAEDDDEHDGDLALTRTASRQHSPPELTIDSDSDSEDEQMPPSPPQLALAPISEKERAAIATSSYYDAKTESISSFYSPDQQTTIIAAY